MFSINDKSNTENIISLTSQGCMENRIANQILKNNKDINNIKSVWTEKNKNKYMEDNLENELEEYRTQIDNEQHDFEENLQFNQKITEHEFIEEITENTLYSTKNSSAECIMKLKPITRNDPDILNFVLSSGHGDFLESVYLEIQIGENLNGLSLEDKFNLLHTDISFSYSEDVIDKKNILTCIFTELCNEKNIIETEDTIQIPIYNFKNFKIDNFIGFPLILTTYKNISFILYNHKKIPYLYNSKLIIKMKCLQNKIKYIQENRYGFIPREFLILFNQETIIKNSYSNIPLSYKFIGKCLLLYFKPKENVDFFDYIIDYPIINSAKLILNDSKNITEYNQNQDGLYYDTDEILNFDFFGIKIYIIPLSEEFSTWEKILNATKNPHKNLIASGINFSKNNKSSLHLDISDSASKYDLVIDCLSFNTLKICGGIFGVGFV
jgi:hypothetical protein